MKCLNFKTLVPFTLLLFVLSSCKPKPETFIPHLNGYWEISRVTLTNGEEKNYTINETIDFIETDSNKGVRKKLKVVLGSKFQTSTSQEDFTITIENDSLNLYYNTPFSKWKETVLKASETELITTNNNATYFYKKYKPIVVN